MIVNRVLVQVFKLVVDDASNSVNGKARSGVNAWGFVVSGVLTSCWWAQRPAFLYSGTLQRPERRNFIGKFKLKD